MNPIENLWTKLKKQVHVRKLTNWTEPILWRGAVKDSTRSLWMAAQSENVFISRWSWRTIWRTICLRPPSRRSDPSCKYFGFLRNLCRDKTVSKYCCGLSQKRKFLLRTHKTGSEAFSQSEVLVFMILSTASEEWIVNYCNTGWKSFIYPAQNFCCCVRFVALWRRTQTEKPRPHSLVLLLRSWGRGVVYLLDPRWRGCLCLHWRWLGGVGGECGCWTHFNPPSSPHRLW